MKIIGIKNIDDTLVISLDTKLPDTVSEDLYLYIDTLDNYTKRNSDNSEEHSCSILLISAEEGDMFNISEDRYHITLDATSPFASAFTVSIEDSTVFYYDREELYYKQIDLLCTSCSTCLDDQQKDRIMLFILKYNLLQYAIEHDIMNDAVQYYKDIARMLGICINNSIFNDGHFDCNRCKKVVNSCCNCKNGCCSLC